MASRLMVLRAIPWRRLLRPGRAVVSGILLLALAVGSVLAMRMLRPATPVQIVPGQALAWEIARSASHSEGVQLASGAYVAGDTMLLYTRTAQTDRARVRTWALLQIGPFADRLAKMPAKETLKWVIDFGPAPGEREVISAPLSQAADPTLYSYTSGAPGLVADAGASPAAVAMPQAPADPAPAAPTSAPTSAVAAQPATTVVTTTLATAPGTPLVNTSFEGTGDGALKGWHSLAGDWAAKDGVYSQRDISGYDFISMLDLAPQSNYSMDARIRLGAGDMGGGFIYNAPSQITRAGAQVVDMDNKGGFLRWGHYDDKGSYVYEGGVKVDPALNDGQWHSLNLLTHAGASAVTIDGKTLGTIKNTSPSGYLGLVASKTQVDFDSVSVTLQPQSGAVPSAAAPAPTAAPAASNPITSTTTFSDTFADGNADGWQVLNGAWQVINQEYQQTSTSGFDLGSISTFQSDAYTVQSDVYTVPKTPARPATTQHAGAT